MSGWLTGKRVLFIGEHEAIAHALSAQGATFVAEGPSELLVHIGPDPDARPSHELSHEDWRISIDAGLDQRFFAAKSFADERRQAGAAGAVLFAGAPEQALGSDHAAAAGALGNLTKTLAVEWARDGIRVNTILTSHAGEALGNVAAYLLSDYAAYVTGAVMGIDERD